MEKKQFAYAIILSIVNLFCGILHFAFEFFLLSNTSVHREFLLIENVLIAFIFLYFSYVFMWGTHWEKKYFAKMGIYFWGVFLIAVLVFQPEVTSLSMIKWLLPIPQKYIVLLFGIMAFILSCINYKNFRVLVRDKK